MTPHYSFPHHIVLGYIVLWTLAELVAAAIWPIRKSCKKVSLLHCIVAFVVSSVWLIKRIWLDGSDLDDNVGIDAALHNFELPGTLEHHVVSLSFAYFLVDMPFAIAFHPAFIVHHAICIVAFAAIQGYWKYLPEGTPFYMDFMAWDTTPVPPTEYKHKFLRFLNQKPVNDSGIDVVPLQLLMGGVNGVFNLWMAELGGVFFHINRALEHTDMELPSRGLFLFMFTFTRCFVWPTYLFHLFRSATESDATHFHKVSMVLETGLFLTNLNFLYKNLAPIWKTGRLIPGKEEGYHRKWLDNHPTCRRIAGLFLRREKISMCCNSGSSLDLSVPADPVVVDGDDNLMKKKEK